mmetsp:Transcript_90981/g.167040  ORF Transcript_90981/g.167040 Transcript_90981/m.167040 type:complete len:90 (-) Transcript_90981:356-625(-)
MPPQPFKETSPEEVEVSWQLRRGHNDGPQTFKMQTWLPTHAQLRRALSYPSNTSVLFQGPMGHSGCNQLAMTRWKAKPLKWSALDSTGP